MSKQNRIDSTEGPQTRYDVAELPAMETTPEGYLRGEVPVTRTGVFTYMNADGTIRKELRHPDDILRTDSLDTIKGRPGTLDHPPATADNPRRMVNAKNVKQLQIGFSSDNYRVDSGFVVQTITVTDAAAIAAIKAGKRGISMGYTLDCVEENGTYNGESYTHRQKQVAYNHWAAVGTPRAGSGARMRLDASEAVQVQPTEIQEYRMDKTPEELARLAALAAMGTVRIDGIEYRGSPELVNAYTKAQAAVVAAEQKATAATTRADAADGAKDGAVTELKTYKAGEQARIDAAVTARVTLLDNAGIVLGDKLDRKLGNRAVMEAVLKHGNKDINLDGKSEDYVSARFDQAIEAARANVQGRNRQGNGGQQQAKPAGANPQQNQGGSNMDSAEPDAEASRKKYGEDMSNAWRKPKAAA